MPLLSLALALVIEHAFQFHYYRYEQLWQNFGKSTICSFDNHARQNGWFSKIWSQFKSTLSRSAHSHGLLLNINNSTWLYILILNQLRFIDIVYEDTIKVYLTALLEYFSIECWLNNWLHALPTSNGVVIVDNV